MLRDALGTLAAAALYGFSLGALDGWGRALRSALKFPLLILVTCGVCALACFVVARVLAPRLGFGEVQALVLRLYRDTALLLVSLAPATLFLARTLTPAASRDALHDYPFFLGLNVVLIAAAGTLALLRQSATLLTAHGLGPGRRATLMAAWLALSLFVGGPWAFYLRPFFGLSAIRAEDAGFCDGNTPDFRGATNFFEAVWHLVDPAR